ncbi:diaminopimelate decarboxylase [Streptomyces sp. NPDC015131]|uniref:diaminopimelate decarboxylase n=1 Tax=Streptomyces sp. NPDC015131 TaxID=3364941 RepID=UPI0037027A47
MASDRRDLAVRAAVDQALLTGTAPVAALLDTDGVRASAAALRAAFAAVTDAPVLHAFAVKASPLVPVLRLLYEAGLGAEVASPGELALARAAGVDPARIVLDSPAKTMAELGEALALGIAVNADNFQELARLDALVGRRPTRSPIGLRVNPQIGAGAIDALSTATATSKFGIALRDEGARARVVRAYLDRPWLTRLHTHSGSQGVPLPLLATGIREVYRLAEEINAAAGRRQIDTLDIGGGLPVNFSSDEETPTYAEYARLLADGVPGLFDGRYGLVTEFGRSLLAKHGTVLARVEYTKTSGERPIAVTHAGVQVATRTVYDPDSWPLRIAVYDAKGMPRTGGGAVEQDVAGPACFAGDLLAVGRRLPPIEPGDIVAALDTGAYYFAHHYAYNSLARPGVYGFTVREGGDVRFATVRPPQTLAEIVAEAGGGRPDVLLMDAAGIPPAGRGKTLP